MKILVLAGGSGTRLWPLSRIQFPKQFLRLHGQDSFLQQTLKRNLNLVDAQDLYILTQQLYLQDVLHQLEAFSPLLKQNILLEPEAKNTASAVAFAIAQLQLPLEELLLIVPSDHLITPDRGYQQAVEKALNLAEKGFLVTFGVRPSRPETGYGYIKPKENSSENYRVDSFVEKPDLATAEKYLLNGHFFWNSGLFLFSVASFVREAKVHSPQLLSSDFASLPTLSLDYGLMEKSQEVAMVILEANWSDIGSWQSVYSYSEKDENANVLQGNVVALDTCNSLVLAEHRLVSTIGLQDIVVIETDDAVLVANKQASQRVREIVGQLKTAGKQEASTHLMMQRPWGFFRVLREGSRYKIKQICVESGQRLSLQLHYHRSEHWVVVRGTAQVTIGEEQRTLHEGESLFVPKSSLHRVLNPGKVALEIIEVQVGEYLGEDDILRLEDAYGRLEETQLFAPLRTAVLREK